MPLVILQIEPHQSGDGDDTALNAIRMTCAYRDNDAFAGTLSPDGSPWGSWSDEVNCIAPAGNQYFFKSFDLQVEEYQVGIRHFLRLV